MTTRPENNASNPPAPPNPPEPVGPRPRVLIVDDEQAILNTLRRLLRNEGYEIFVVRSGNKALQVLETLGSVDLLVTDFRMADMTGIQLLEQVRERWPETQRVMLTGYSEVGTILDAVNRGSVYKYLVKPWNDEELKLNLRRSIEQGSLRTANRRLVDEVEKKNQSLVEMVGRLQQDCRDAVRGLNFNQALFEWIDAAVVTVDEDGMVVGANANLLRLLRADAIGLAAQDALPEAMHAALQDDPDYPGGSGGRIDLDGRRLQWRARTFTHGPAARGRVITLWEQL